MQELNRSKNSIDKPSQTVTIRLRSSSKKTWHCKHKEMYIRPSNKDVKARSVNLLSKVMCLVQMIPVNIVTIIEKNTTPEEDDFYEYPYYIARIQIQFISTKIRWFRAQYPHHRFIIEELNNANSIHVFNRFKKETM